MTISNTMKQAIIIFLIFYAGIQIPCSAFVADYFVQNSSFLRTLTLGQYFFASLMGLIPLKILWKSIVLPLCYSEHFVLNILRIIVIISVLILCIAANAYGFTQLASDAQAALTFVIFPIYIALIPWLSGFFISLFE